MTETEMRTIRPGLKSWEEMLTLSGSGGVDSKLATMFVGSGSLNNELPPLEPENLVKPELPITQPLNGSKKKKATQWYEEYILGTEYHPNQAVKTQEALDEVMENGLLRDDEKLALIDHILAQNPSTPEHIEEESERATQQAELLIEKWNASRARKKLKFIALKRRIGRNLK